MNERINQSVNIYTGRLPTDIKLIKEAKSDRNRISK